METRQFELLPVVRWTARGLSVMLFLLWGAFFVEHLEWFFNAPQRPPLSVWLLQGLHLLMLAGLLIALRWELAGSLLVVVSGALFFTQTASREALPLIVLTAIPALLFAFCWWWEGRHAQSAPPEWKGGVI